MFPTVHKSLIGQDQGGGAAIGIHRPMVEKWDLKLKKSILWKSDLSCSLMAPGANIDRWQKGDIRELHENMSQYIPVAEGSH